MIITEKAKELSNTLTDEIRAAINKALDGATLEDNIEYIISSAIYNNVARFTTDSENDTFPVLVEHMMKCLIRDLPKIKEDWESSNAK
jgi:hypothetical protein